MPTPRALIRSKLACQHIFPFWTVDLETPDGSKITIEQRASTEVTHMAGRQIAPDGVENSAFDVTPNRYVAAIITERGIARVPYGQSLRELSGVAVGA